MTIYCTVPVFPYEVNGVWIVRLDEDVEEKLDEGPLEVTVQCDITDDIQHLLHTEDVLAESLGLCWGVLIEMFVNQWCPQRNVCKSVVSSRKCL